MRMRMPDDEPDRDPPGSLRPRVDDGRSGDDRSRAGLVRETNGNLHSVLRRDEAARQHEQAPEQREEECPCRSQRP